jgi:two-component system sensor histidine kinase/response regulator
MTSPSLTGSILIVDDTPANLDFLSAMLEDRNYHVRAVINGTMAFKAIQSERPDLILLDIRMPEMDGYEVCRRLKVDKYTADIPVIFISALDDTMDKVRAFQTGGVDYVTKPFQFEEVVARVESQLMLAQQRKEIEMLREKDRLYFEQLGCLKDEFLGMASHDLKNPIGVVMVYVDILLNNMLPGSNGSLNDPKVRSMLEKIKGAAQRMHYLVTDLLDIAKIETGLALSMTAVQLNEFLQACFEDFEVVAQEKGIQLIFNPPETDAILNIDPQRMAQVVGNLLSNAIKYTPSGGCVELEALVKIDHVVINVKDTGFGIPEKDISHLFDRFYRVDNQQHRAVEGTGLGLSIVKSLVEQHSGTISVQSEVGHSSIFSVILPYLLI